MRARLNGFLAGTLLAAALTGCDDLCSSELLRSVRAPDGTIARLEKKNCGATVDYIYEVKAVDRDGSSHLVLRFDPNNSMGWPDDAHVMDMRWRGSQLELDIHPPVRVFRQKSKLNGVPVRYTFAPGSEL